MIFAVITAIIGFLLGIVIGNIIRKEKPAGDLRVDRSDPTCAPYLFLELDTDVQSIMQKEYVTFRVRAENYIPHK